MRRSSPRLPNADDTMLDEGPSGANDTLRCSTPDDTRGDTLSDEDTTQPAGARTVASFARPRDTSSDTLVIDPDPEATTLSLRGGGAHLDVTGREGDATLPLPLVREAPQHGDAEIATLPLGTDPSETATLQLDASDDDHRVADAISRAAQTGRRSTERLSERQVVPHAARTVPVVGSHLVDDAPVVHVSAPAVVDGRVVVHPSVPPRERTEHSQVAVAEGPALWQVVLGVVIVGSLLGWVIGQAAR